MAASASGEVDSLTLHLSTRELLELSAEQKGRLRQVAAKWAMQNHFADSKFASHYGASGARNAWEQKMNQKVRERLQVKLREWAFIMPLEHEFFNGMGHMNDDAKYRDQRWHPVRAIASAKVHLLPKIREVLDEEGAGANLHGATVKFAEVYPDTSPASGGLYPLTKAGWQALKDSGIGIKSDADFVQTFTDTACR